MNQEYKVVKRKYEHQLVIGKRDGLDIDHIDGNKKNNDPNNLRHLPRRLNALHRFNPMAGIDFHNLTGKWRVRVGTKHLGLYTSKEEAQLVRAEAVQKAFKEWANEPSRKRSKRAKSASGGG